MLFFQLNHFQPAAAGQKANLTWMDYKFIHVPRKGVLDLFYLHYCGRYLMPKPGGGGLSREMS